ncbi:MAG: Exoenzyme regulatory protein AepA in lipid-linked oligosaccharide synthesis cluster [Frankiales bacterium]|nr:Exoenzyme regulatory protein AepA in lipid-linked oligosaccharide synthesis cluster [Frankiales bacterium]
MFCWHTLGMRTLLHGGRIHTSWATDAAAMIVDGGEIAWLGDDESAEAIAVDARIDLQGALVVPAFVDAHFHATDTGLARTGLDLKSVRSLQDALRLVESHARSRRGRPLIGSGWDETSWPEQRPPTSAELDRASYGGAVYLARIDAHSAVVSSTLKIAVPGLDGLDGYRADGLLTGDAHHAARAVALSVVEGGYRQELQRSALEHAAGLGIASVHEMAGPEISSADDLSELSKLAAGGGLPEVFGYWGELGAGGIATAQELGAAGAGGDLFCDGSMGSHTAALSAPYADTAASDTVAAIHDGVTALRFELDELVEHIVACTEAGIQAGFHAIGDLAVDQVIDAMHLAGERLGRARVFGAGHRIEHVELVNDIARLAATGLIASVQPAFDASWGGPGGMYERRLGADRAARMNPFAMMAAAGVPLAFGSDSPVTPIDPWGAVRAAVHPSNPAHAITPRAAFNAHTRGGWRAARREGNGSGTLAPGAPATYAVFAAGSLGVDAPDDRVSRWSTDERANLPGLPDLSPALDLPRCLRTVLRGSPIYDSGELG